MLSKKRAKRSDKKASIREINGRYYDDIYIPLSFENAILRHVIVNSLSFSTYKPSPLLLIQGKKGEGKSFMTEVILKSNNIKYKFISSSVLAGKNENDAAENLKLYYNALQMKPQQGIYSALVIDDFHLSIAISKESATHTTNADNLLSALMNIADRKEPLKTPIILIGNDFSKAYAPLTRLGRTTISTWKPEIDEKVEIVKSLISRRSHATEALNHELVTEFVKSYENEYIGFFETVIENLIFDSLSDVVENFSASSGQVSYGSLSSWVKESTQNKVVTIQGLYDEAKRLKSIRPEKFDGEDE